MFYKHLVYQVYTFPGVIGYYALSISVLRRPIIMIITLWKIAKKKFWSCLDLAPSQIITVISLFEHSLG